MMKMTTTIMDKKENLPFFNVTKLLNAYMKRKADQTVK